jgi:hypothetical protein
MASTKKLILEYNYQPSLVPGFEDESRVLVLGFLSADLGHGYCVRVVGSHNNQLELDIQCPTVGSGGISPSAGLTLRFGCAGMNDQGTPTIRQVGSAFFPIAKLLVANKTQLPTEQVIFPNLATATSVPRKGSVTLTAHPCGLTQSSIRAATKYDFVPENSAAFERVLIDYQRRAGEAYEQLKATFPNAQGLRMPIWRSGHLIAPGALVALPRAKPASEAWWLNCLIAATRRAFPELSSEAETFARLQRFDLTESERMNILMLAHTAVVAAGTCYVSDGIYVKRGDDIPLQALSVANRPRFNQRIAQQQSQPQKQSMEQFLAGGIQSSMPTFDKQLVMKFAAANGAEDVEFRGAEDFSVGWARLMKSAEWGCRGSIDCEDGGIDICMQAMDFMTGHYEHPILNNFQEAAKNYDVAQLLKYVNGDQLSNSLHTNRLGGHMDAGYITRDYEVRLQGRVLEGFAGRIDSIGNGVTGWSGGRAPADYVQNPVIIGEGTGLMSPLADDIQAARMESLRLYLGLHTSAALAGKMRGVRYMMPHAKTTDNRFYNSVLSRSARCVSPTPTQ